MVGAFISIPVILLLAMLQTVVVSRMPLLNGSADLLILFLAAWSLNERVRGAWIGALLAGGLIAYVSALPPFVPVVSYLAVALMAWLLKRQIWQTPILAMLVTTITGTLFSQVFTLIILTITGTPLPLGDSFLLIILPSTLLNLILALPAYALVNDMAGWLYPPLEVEA